MNKLSRTWSLMSACWRILAQDKQLLVFPLISGVCCLLLLGSFAVPLYVTGSWQPPGGEAGAARHALYYGTLFLFYVCNYFIVIFFNCGIVACAVIRMRGGNPTVADGFRAAGSRLQSIAGWAVVSATIGLALRMIEDRSEKVGQMVAGLLGMAWTVVSYLVIPILAVDGTGPITALKESTQLLKKTWGEQLMGNFSFGLMFFLLAVPAIILIILSVLSGSAAAIILCIGLGVVYLIGLALVQSALQSIFQAALYLYARNGQVPDGFQSEFLSGAMIQR